MSQSLVLQWLITPRREFNVIILEKNIELTSLLQNLIEQHGCQMWPSILLFALLEQKKARFLSWIGGLIPKQNEEQVVDTLSHFKFLCLTKGFLFWVACTASLCVAFHDAPVVDILPSPHIANTVLSIGGRIWALWKSVDLVCSNSIFFITFHLFEYAILGSYRKGRC